jgi:hypothetical protein
MTVLTIRLQVLTKTVCGFCKGTDRFIYIYLGCNETDMFKIDLFVMLNLQKIQNIKPSI